MTKAISSSSGMIPLDSQVGGHSGVLTTEDGSLLIKPALPLELEFYRSLQIDAALSHLLPFTPSFHGIRTLESDEGHKTESLILENLAHPFSKPNILDCKLGTVLYDEAASPEKVEAMKKTARETTSLETGIRLTGFQVYDNLTGQPVNTPKSYGKSIKVSDLPDGIAKFFPVHRDVSTSNTNANASPSHKPSTNGLPPQTFLPILRAIRQNVAQIQDALSNLHMRMVGGSLLIVYEADWIRAEEGVKALTGTSEEVALSKSRSPFVVKLIDFAHTRILPGQGPDEGVLLGLDTFLGLLDGRIEEVRNFQ